MKRIICLVLLFVFAITLNSCMKEGSSMFVDRDTQLADSCIEQVVDAIRQNNGSDLKNLFSEKAISESKEIDGEINELFSFIEGEVVSHTWDGLPVTEDCFEFGKRRKCIYIWFELETKEKKYLVFLKDFPTDTITPANVGLYLMCIFESEDEDFFEDYIWDSEGPGVHILNNQT